MGGEWLCGIYRKSFPVPKAIQRFPMFSKVQCFWLAHALVYIGNLSLCQKQSRGFRCFPSPWNRQLLEQRPCSYYCVLVSRIHGILYVKQNSSIRLHVRTRLQTAQVHDRIWTDLWIVKRITLSPVSWLTLALARNWKSSPYCHHCARNFSSSWTASHLVRHVYEPWFLRFLWQSFSSCLWDRHPRPNQL